MLIEAEAAGRSHRVRRLYVACAVLMVLTLAGWWGMQWLTHPNQFFAQGSEADAVPIPVGTSFLASTESLPRGTITLISAVPVIHGNSAAATVRVVMCTSSQSYQPGSDSGPVTNSCSSVQPVKGVRWVPWRGASARGVPAR